LIRCVQQAIGPFSVIALISSPWTWHSTNPFLNISLKQDGFDL
jgi:hypothetical protein